MILAEHESKSTLSVAVCQLTSVDDFNKSLDSIMKLLARLEANPPDLVCLPENALYMRLHEGQPVPGIEPDHEVIKKISEWAIKFGVVVHVGSVPLKKDGRLYNSSLVLTPDGAVHDSYHKIHLFDVDVIGHKPMRESDAFTHGAAPSIFTIKGWKIGSSICYDVRFAELYVHYAKQEVDVVLVPAAFLPQTGQAHWEVLTRARAIETQAYVLAAAQGGQHQGSAGGTRVTHGHSMIIDPWGAVLASVKAEFVDDDRIIQAELSRERIAKVRAQIPIKDHRRLSL